MVLGMARRLTVALAEPNDVLELYRRRPQRFIFGNDGTRSGEMERRPEQHRSMSIREYEAITVGPDRIFRIESQHAIPDRIHQRRQGHWRTGMSRLSLLHRVDREGTNGV